MSTSLATRSRAPMERDNIPVDRSFIQTEESLAIVQVHRHVGRRLTVAERASLASTLVTGAVPDCVRIRYAKTIIKANSDSTGVATKEVNVLRRRGHFVNSRQNPVGWFGEPEDRARGLRLTKAIQKRQRIADAHALREHALREVIV
jgi:hypothetical protein